MISVLDALPEEGMEVRVIGVFTGERRAYMNLIVAVPVWTEAVDGPDRPIPDVTHWERVAPPPQEPEVRGGR